MSAALGKIKQEVASELARCFKQRDMMIAAELSTSLVTALALVITQSTGGDAERGGNVLEAMSNLLFEEASRLRGLAVAMHSFE